MKFDPQKHHRRSIRLEGYDYSQTGMYYVTIVAQGREHLFGEVVNAEMKLNRFGKIVEHAWFDLPNHYRHVELDAFVIMPNHVHGIIVLNDDAGAGLVGAGLVGAGLVGAGLVGAGLRPAPTIAPAKRHPLSEIVRAFKSFSARRINSLRKTQGIPVWQRNYYEHIIRDYEDYLAKYNYILDNPLNWENDDENI